MSCRIYPVTETELYCTSYRVKLNGEDMPMNCARVSKYPFNRRWPGHQRGLEQSEMANFISFSMDEPVDIEVFPERRFESVVIRPTSANLQYELTDHGSIIIHIDKPRYFTVEPFGRHDALHVFADPMKDYGVDIHDENVLYFGKGTHEVGMINLKSNQTVFIDEGAVVYACIHADDADNIRILGHGILDNSHNKEEILFETTVENNDAAVMNAKRLHTVQLKHCTNIEIDGITIRDSLVYNIKPICCSDISIRNVKIIGCWRYNADGIDMHNCENAFITDCFLRTFDDSFCIKGFDPWMDRNDLIHNGKDYDYFKNVVIQNSVIWNDWGKCLEIGMETQAKEISNIVYRNCDIIHVTGPVMDCGNVDYADIHDITFENINIEYDDVIPQPKLQRTEMQTYAGSDPDPDFAPALFFSEVIFHHEYSAKGFGRGKNHDFRIKNIHLYGRQMPRIKLQGYDKEHQCSDFLFEDIYWNDKKINDLSDIDYSCNEYCENITLR